MFSAFPYISTSELGVLNGKVNAFAIRHTKLQVTIGQDVVNIGGVTFDYLS